MHDVKPLLFRSGTDFPAIQRQATQILQVNLGYRCNLSCVHCHVNAGPKRTEMMSEKLVEQVIGYLEVANISVLDLTGGAPEMHPQFQHIVRRARALGVEVIDRCNLTILKEPGYEQLGRFLADQKVHIVASLPCYAEENVEKQRGKGVFQTSIEVLQALNRLGYGKSGSGLLLDLVYNPGGPFLPPAQVSLQAAYKKELFDKYDVEFNQLLTLTNMPIARFGSTLVSKGQFDSYMTLLKENFSEQNLLGLMCKSTISVDWQGYLYDCDFNQMLNIDMPNVNRESLSGSGEEKSSGDSRDKYQHRMHISDLFETNVEGRAVAIADHCFGCTAGQGSSCGGALT